MLRYKFRSNSFLSEALYMGLFMRIMITIIIITIIIITTTIIIIIIIIVSGVGGGGGCLSYSSAISWKS